MSQCYAQYYMRSAKDEIFYHQTKPDIPFILLNKRLQLA